MKVDRNSSGRLGMLRAPLVLAAAAAAVSGAGLVSAGAAGALPPGGSPIHCRVGYHWDGDECVPNTPPPPPPPPVYNPVGFLDVAQETTGLATVHVAGWAADGDSPTSPISVRVYVNNSLAATVVADRARPDVAAAYPAYGQYHGYDVSVPASNAANTICVTAVNVGSGADVSLGCKTEDYVTGFTG